MSRSPFDALADDYDAARPAYPADLYAAVSRLAAVDWPRARVLDVGAGTGIATRAMRERGAFVVAADVGARMLGRLRRRDPSQPAVVARAERLPVRAGRLDLVTFAQAWHWVDVDAATAEVVRVLRPGGALAVWWNDVDPARAPWYEHMLDRLEAANPGWGRDYRARDYGTELAATGRFAGVETWTGTWERRLDLDTYERWQRSKSYVAALGERLPDFLAADRAAMTRTFPDGVVREPFRVKVWVARR